MKKFLSILLVLCLMASGIAGCAAEEEPASEPEVAPEEEAVVVELPSAALLMAGPISDMNWNAGAYDGLLAIENNYGTDVSFVESISQSDMEDVFRTYATEGYELVFGHGAQFNDACLQAAADFPDTQFVMVNGTTVQDNLITISINQGQQGYLMGVFAALMTETGTVGMIGGMEIPPVSDAVAGFKAGAEYINPDIRILNAMTGDFVDGTKAKETALAMIDEGADYIGSVLGGAALGCIEACAEGGIYAIGTGGNEIEIAPDTVIVSSLTELPVLYTYIYDKAVDGTLENTAYSLGIKENAVHLSSFGEFEDFVPQDVKDKLQEVTDAIIAGEITI